MVNHDPKKSAQPCGCDPGCGEEGYLCERHRSTQEPTTQSAEVPGILTVRTFPTTQPIIGSHEWRKQRPLWSGVMKYFPDALLEVAYVSWVGNEQHNPGTPLHWDRSKSQDEQDACARHLAEAGTFDTDGCRHSAKAAWRALANLQKELEQDRQQ